MSFLACNDFAELVNDEDFIVLVAIVMGSIVGSIAIAGGTITSVVKSRARETTKRELAAYVAEGMLDPEQAIRMANAGMTKWERPDKV